MCEGVKSRQAMGALLFLLSQLIDASRQCTASKYRADEQTGVFPTQASKPPARQVCLSVSTQLTPGIMALG